MRRLEDIHTTAFVPRLAKREIDEMVVDRSKHVDDCVFLPFTFGHELQNTSFVGSWPNFDFSYELCFLE